MMLRQMEGRMVGGAYLGSLSPNCSYEDSTQKLPYVGYSVDVEIPSFQPSYSSMSTLLSHYAFHISK